MSWTSLKSAIKSVIKTNNNQEITGEILQNTLITIVNSVGANATFAGVAIPSTNPGTPDGPVFYLASQAGRYSNFGNVEIEQGKLYVFTWDGTVWSHAEILDIDNIITSTNGLVYDVSVKHPASGVDSGNTYTLSGALAVIPAADRKAGMSIKFIDSEKNEYVQYRFLGANTDGFTTVANWQGVDDAPTAGSNGLPKSDGTMRQIANLSNLVGGNIYENANGGIEESFSIEYTSKVLSATTGLPRGTYNGFGTTEKIYLSGKTNRYILKTPHNIDNDSLASAVFYDNNDTPLYIVNSTASKGGFQIDKYIGLEVPYGVSYVRFSYYNSKPIRLWRVPKERYNVNPIFDMGSAVRMEDLTQVAYTKLETNAIFGNPLNGYETSDYIAVSPQKYKHYFFYLRSFSASYTLAAFYDADKNLLHSVVGNGLESNKLFKIFFPKGTAYVRYARLSGSDEDIYGLYLETNKDFNTIIKDYALKSSVDELAIKCDDLIGKSQKLTSIEEIPNKYINSDGQLTSGGSSFTCYKYNITSCEFVYLESSASHADVYAYTILDESSNVLAHAEVNTLTKTEFVLKVPENAVYLLICKAKYTYSLSSGYILEQFFGFKNELVDETESYKDLAIAQTIPSKFVYNGNINSGSQTWWVGKYDIRGISGILHLYSDAVTNESVYAYTIHDFVGNKLVWATEAVGSQREYTIDLTVLEGACYLYVTVPRYVQIMEKGVLPAMANNIGELAHDIFNINRNLNSFNKFIGYYTPTNNVVWVGTSIPEGSTYPAKACEKCNYNCINNAYGSSQLRWTGMHPSTVTKYSGRCLTATVAELEAMFRQDVTDGIITEATLEQWKNKSYERSIIPYIDGTNASQASMIVIDHGFNDRNKIYEMMQDVEHIDWASRDRSSFVGAFNYLMDRIQEINPTIKIVISGYFQNTYIHSTNPSNDYHSAEICAMQELIAQHYSISIMKAWEHTQINNEYVAGTNNYIANFNAEYGTSYSKVNPDSEGNIKSMQLYCPDMVHPHSDLTGNCNKRLNAVYSKLLKDLL